MPQLNAYSGGSTWKAPFYKAVDAASNSVYHVFTAEGLQAWASAAASSPSTAEAA